MTAFRFLSRIHQSPAVCLIRTTRGFCVPGDFRRLRTAFCCLKQLSAFRSDKAILSNIPHWYIRFVLRPLPLDMAFISFVMKSITRSRACRHERTWLWQVSRKAERAGKNIRHASASTVRTPCQMSWYITVFRHITNFCARDFIYECSVWHVV